MAAPFHRHEPPHCFINRAADRNQAVVSQDCRLVRSERFRDPVAFAGLGNEYARVVEENMILVEGAGVLRDRVEDPADRGPGLPYTECAWAAATISGRAAWIW